ncbi:hypothetical protein [Kitasatospora sp. NPDC057015]|uniref:hypothetical protein n=1 Tax=Kitasatospora sp. NPDC057015 TaxID=3346001 RepID=UPI003639DDB0
MDGLERRLPPLRAGRQPAGRALLSWLDDPRAPRLCRISGPPGSGKTHLLTWLVAACASPGTPAGHRPDAVLAATGLTLDGATWSLGHRLGASARTPAELTAALREDDRPRLLVVRDLDRAAEPAAISAGLLDPLLALPGLRLLVEAATGSPEAAALTAVAPAAVLELDDPLWTDAGRFASWYQRLRGDSPFDAEQAYPGPGAALLAAKVPPGAGPPTGPVAAAWWAALPAELRPALAALAAAGRPLTGPEWSLLADPGAVRRAGELLPPDSPAGDTWWLPAGPLREQVTATLAEPDPRAALTALHAALPRTPDGALDLPGAGGKRLGLLLGQAVRAGGADGLLDALLDDPAVLAQADPTAVTAAFAARPGSRLAPAWRAAGPALVHEPEAAVRAELLRVRLLGPSHAPAPPPAGGAGWRAEWAHWLPPAEPPLVTAALGAGPYAGQLLLADGRGVLRSADLATGALSAPAPFSAPPGVRALACLADGAILALDVTGVPRSVAGAAPPALPAEAVSALTNLPAVGDPAGVVHWPVPGQESRERLHDGPVTAVGGVLLPAQDLAAAPVPLLLSGGVDGRVRGWSPTFPPLPEPLHERPCPVVSVSVAQTSAGLVMAAAWTDGVVRIQCPAEGDGCVELRLGSPVTAVEVDPAGRVVVVLLDGVVCLRPDRDGPATARG